MRARKRVTEDLAAVAVVAVSRMAAWVVAGSPVAVASRAAAWAAADLPVADFPAAGRAEDFLAAVCRAALRKVPRHSAGMHSADRSALNSAAITLRSTAAI